MSARKYVLVGVALLGLGSSAAQADSLTFLQFNADRDNGSAPAEFKYDSMLGLTVGDGSSSNGQPYAPGLNMTVTGGVPYGPFQPDSSLAFTLGSFQPAAPAVNNGGSITQDLTGGDFIVKDTLGTTLLTGSAISAQLTRNADNSAAVLSGTVTYTGGVLQGLLAVAGFTDMGTFSFNLSGLTGTTTIDGTGHLSSFQADGAGTFDAVPIPVPLPAAPAGGAVLLGALAVARVRRQHAVRA